MRICMLNIALILTRAGETVTVRRGDAGAIWFSDFLVPGDMGKRLSKYSGKKSRTGLLSPCPFPTSFLDSFLSDINAL